jgi:tRNA 2-selenouridine synthase
MRESPVLEVRRPIDQRVAHLVRIYGVQEPQALAEATQRIARRLGPQRTALALEAIDRGDWATACRQMLDYYDRCYDHELREHQGASVDLGKLEASAAAEELLARRLVLRA